MKLTKHIMIVALLTGLAAGTLSLRAADQNKQAKPRPYPLDKCLVSGEKLGDHGKPYVFTHEGQEIKLCCEDCLKDFKQNPAKHMKAIAAAQKKEKK